MKILLIHNFYANTGGEDLTVQETERLLMCHGHTVVAYTAFSGGRNILSKILILFGAFFSIVTFFRLLKVIIKEKPDVAHVFNVFPILSPSAYIILSVFKMPIVQTIENYRIMYSLRDIIDLLKSVFSGRDLRKSLLEYGYCSWNDFIYFLSVQLNKLIGSFSGISYYIAPSKYIVGRLMKNGIENKRIYLISNIVRFRVSKTKKHSHKKMTIVYAGRLSYEKGVDILLSSLHHDFYGNIVIIGDGPERTRLEDITKKQKLPVTFLGKKTHNETLFYLRTADICVVPSRWPEPFGNSILDAMSSGALVIASRVGGIPEIVQDKKTGLLFESDNSNDLREKINWVISHPSEKEKIITEAYQSLQKYNSRAYVTRLEIILNKAISRHTV